jgi:ABC-2 type transport system ATP-binding protein
LPALDAEQEGQGGEGEAMTAPLLEVSELRKSYGTVQALAGVSFRVEAGEVFGLLGPNGAGKTTLLSILSCLLAADAGEVRLDGKPIRISDRDIRRRIGIVPQELALYEGLTARENLHFFGELYGLKQKALRDRVERLLAAVGLEARAGHRVATFSGGMKRRLNLACALVHEPHLVLLDEPTVGVDPQSRNLIFEEVRRLNAGGLTVVYTSHYMEEVEALCSRIGIIDNGLLLACDTLPNLLHMLRGLVRFRLPEVPAVLEEKLGQLPDCRFTRRDEQVVELECSDVKGTLVRLITLLNEYNVALAHLQTQEPNLERVFLHLTGHALRD